MEGDLGKSVLKDVSRSFYLSLRLLPQEMRAGTSVGYLLARTSDTIADTSGLPVTLRMEWLERFSESLLTAEPIHWPVEMMDPLVRSERVLFQRTDDMLRWLSRLTNAEQDLVKEVVSVIIAGQQLDLERFSGASASQPVSLTDAAELEDYTWRGAGCVGAFWTKLGFLTMGERFSQSPPAALLEKAIRYGKGLQLVNILRDLPDDLAAGRCYLPVEDPSDKMQLMESHAHWLEQAARWVGEADGYTQALESRRLRMASVLPARIAVETLERMRGVSWDQLQKRIKVPRRRVYRLLLQSLFR